MNTCCFCVFVLFSIKISIIIIVVNNINEIFPLELALISPYCILISPLYPDNVFQAKKHIDAAAGEAEAEPDMS